MIADHWEPVKDIPNISRLARIGVKLYDYGIDPNSNLDDKLIGTAVTSTDLNANLLVEETPGEHIINMELKNAEGEDVGTIEVKFEIFKNNLNV